MHRASQLWRGPHSSGVDARLPLHRGERVLDLNLDLNHRLVCEAEMHHGVGMDLDYPHVNNIHGADSGDSSVSSVRPGQRDHDAAGT